LLKGLTKAGLGAVGSEERLVALAADYGFDAVDLEAAPWIERFGLGPARELLHERNIQLGSIALPVEWRASEEQFRSSLLQLASAAEAASALGCTSCCTYILPSTDYDSAPFMAVATRRIRQCASILGAYGIRLGLEFVGPHHLRTRWRNPFIWTMRHTLDWIDAIGEPNVGLLLDVYHWYTNESTSLELLTLRADQIVHVHINDAPAVPIAQVKDNERLYPGEGVIDLAAFMKTLQKIGYSGVVSQEILTPAPPTESAEQLAARSQTAFNRIWSEAGL